MRTEAIALNPFSLMMEPEMVLSAMEHSQQLNCLRRRKLHPLDKPLIPYSKAVMDARAAFDAAIDAEMMEESQQEYFQH
ncbi:MAG: hypothetical protein RIS34_1374 [Pseudomonadota bacterium]|jgi:hypothetical protein